MEPEADRHRAAAPHAARVPPRLLRRGPGGARPAARIEARKLSMGRSYSVDQRYVRVARSAMVFPQGPRATARPVRAGASARRPGRPRSRSSLARRGRRRNFFAAPTTAHSVDLANHSMGCAMEKPKVMTEQEWKQATAVHYVLGIKRLSRSPLLTEIGLHLRMYHAADGLMADVQRDAIWKALLAARIWLDKHPNAKRRIAGETLYKQALWAYVWATYTAQRDSGRKMRTKALNPAYASEARFRSGMGPQGKALKGRPAIMAEYGGGGAVQTGKGYKLFDKVPGWDDPNVDPEELQRG